MGLKQIWDGNDLPPIGSCVLIHLGSLNAWVKHIVTGYKIKPDIDGNKFVHRICIQVDKSDDSNSSVNARLLCDVRPLDWRE